MAKDSTTGLESPMMYRKPEGFTYYVYIGQGQDQLRGLALTSRTLVGLGATQTRDAISPFFLS